MQTPALVSCPGQDEGSFRVHPVANIEAGTRRSPPARRVFLPRLADAAFSTPPTENDPPSRRTARKRHLPGPARHARRQDRSHHRPRRADRPGRAPDPSAARARRNSQMRSLTAGGGIPEFAGGWPYTPKDGDPEASRRAPGVPPRSRGSLPGPGRPRARHCGQARHARRISLIVRSRGPKAPFRASSCSPRSAPDPDETGLRRSPRADPTARLLSADSPFGGKAPAELSRRNLRLLLSAAVWFSRAGGVTSDFDSVSIPCRVARSTSRSPPRACDFLLCRCRGLPGQQRISNSSGKRASNRVRASILDAHRP